MVLSKLGRDEEAAAAASRALTLRSDYPQALNNLGVALEALGRPRQAEAAFRRALSTKPDFAEAWSNLGNALRQLGRPEEAIVAYERAVALNPASPGAHTRKAPLLAQQVRLLEAEAALRDEVAWHPDAPAAHTNHAAVLSESGRSAQVTPEAHNTLGGTLRHLGRFEEAEAACRRALALCPEFCRGGDQSGQRATRTGTHGRSGNDPFATPSPCDTGDLGVQHNLAIVLRDQGRIHEASAVIDLAAALRPDDAETRYHRALLLLLRGRLAEGFTDYEARFATRQGRADRRDFAQPLWSGEPLDGRTILVHAEQGFGDAIQFVRYVPLVARRGGRVVLEVHPQLVGLLDNLPGIFRIVGSGVALPDFDFHTPLLSLPRAFATTVETIPAVVPYLAPPVDALARWHARLPRDGNWRIGIAWAGNARHIDDHRRSLPFAILAPLWRDARAAVGQPASRAAQRRPAGAAGGADR